MTSNVLSVKWEVKSMTPCGAFVVACIVKDPFRHEKYVNGPISNVWSGHQPVMVDSRKAGKLAGSGLISKQPTGDLICMAFSLHHMLV